MNSKLMTRGFGAILVAASLSYAEAVDAASVGDDPFQYYGDEIVFDVVRDGSEVGTHRVTFRRDAGDIVVDSRFEVKIKVLVVPVYSYLYTSTERWRDGKLISLSAETDDNGKKSDVEVTRSEGKLHLKGSGGAFTINGDIYPTTHWNSGVIGATRVINTITGKVNDVTMDDRGMETVLLGNEQGSARHYAYQGDLVTEVWYDDAGRWVKMRFPGKDGVMIEYKCKTCGAAPRRTGDASGTRASLAFNKGTVD